MEEKCYKRGYIGIKFWKNCYNFPMKKGKTLWVEITGYTRTKGHEKFWHVWCKKINLHDLNIGFR